MSREPSDRPGGSRRRVAQPAERSISSTTLLAMVVPVLTVGALALVDPRPTEDPGQPPVSAPLVRTTLVCPPALAGGDDVFVLLAGAGREETGAETETPAGGQVQVRGRDRALDVEPDATVELSDPERMVLQGQDSTAPGLVAARRSGSASTVCTTPVAEAWFTGAGAGAERSSQLTLVNPDGGPAVADVTVLGEDGPVEVPALRGVTVAGNRSVTLDLAALVPRRDELTLHVQVSRGRLGSSVVDRFEELGAGARTADWLPPQPAPSSDDYLLGLGSSADSRTLVVANPGDDEARVSVRLVTPRTEFTPTGLEEVVVPPGSTTSVDLGRALSGRTGRGVVGLRLVGDHPVTASLRSLVGDDLTYAVGAPPVRERAVTPLAPGPKRLVLAGAEQVTTVTVVLRDGRGRQVGTEEITLQPGLGSQDPPGRSRSLRRAAGRAAGARRGRERASGAGRAAPAGARGRPRGAGRPPRAVLTRRRRVDLTARGSTSSGDRPSSSATCSTSTVSTSDRSCSRSSARCSTGRRKITTRVGEPPEPRISEESGTGSSQSSGTSGISSTAYSTRPSSSCQRSSSIATTSRTRSSKRVRAVRAAGEPGRRSTPGPRIPRPRRSRVRRRSGGTSSGAPGDGDGTTGSMPRA